MTTTTTRRIESAPTGSETSPPAPRLSLAQRFRIRRARTAWIRAQLAVCEPASRLDAWDRRSA